MLQKKNHADAQYTIGLLCEYGKGTYESSLDAMEWYLEAAGQGNNDACHSIARLLHDGFGGTTNMKIPLQWYYKCNNKTIFIKMLEDEGEYLSTQEKEKPLQDLVSQLKRFVKNKRARKSDFSYGCAYDNDSDSDGGTEEIYANYSSRHDMVYAINDLQDKVKSLGKQLDEKDDLIDELKSQVHALLNPSEPRIKRVKVDENKTRGKSFYSCAYDSDGDGGTEEIYATYSSRHDMVYAISDLQSKVKSIGKKHSKKNNLIDVLESQVHALRNPSEPRSKRMRLLEDETRGQVDPLPQQALKNEVKQQQEQQQVDASSSQSGCKRQRTPDEEDKDGPLAEQAKKRQAQFQLLVEMSQHLLNK